MVCSKDSGENCSWQGMSSLERMFQANLAVSLCGVMLRLPEDMLSTFRSDWAGVTNFPNNLNKKSLV